MAGGQRLGAQLARRVHQIGEFHFLVAADAGDRRFAARIGVGEILDHVLAEAAFVIQHIMRECRGSRRRAWRHRYPGRRSRRLSSSAPCRIKLQRDADHVIALALEQRGGDGGIHAARHGGDDPGALVVGCG